MQYVYFEMNIVVQLIFLCEGIFATSIVYAKKIYVY